MKRLLPALLTIGLVLTVWAADPPAPNTPGPPVRLKKKKKPEVQPMDPAKPETKPEPPPVKPRKPKLDDDELDPRDDVKLPRHEEPDENEILQRVARNTRLSEEKLGNKDVGEGTRQIQEEALKDLDRLIEQSKQSQQNPQNQQSKDDQGSSPGGGGKPKDGSSAQQQQQQQQQAKERRERRLQRRGQQTAQRSRGGSGQEGQPQQQPQPGQGTTPGGGGAISARGKENLDKTFDLWGHLPEKERALMNKEMEQKFMEKYDELTKQYYRTIAEKSRKK